MSSLSDEALNPNKIQKHFINCIVHKKSSYLFKVVCSEVIQISVAVKKFATRISFIRSWIQLYISRHKQY